MHREKCANRNRANYDLEMQKLCSMKIELEEKEVTVCQPECKACQHEHVD